MNILTNPEKHHPELTDPILELNSIPAPKQDQYTEYLRYDLNNPFFGKKGLILRIKDALGGVLPANLHTLCLILYLTVYYKIIGKSALKRYYTQIKDNPQRKAEFHKQAWLDYLGTTGSEMTFSIDLKPPDKQKNISQSERMTSVIIATAMEQDYIRERLKKDDWQTCKPQLYPTKHQYNKDEISKIEMDSYIGLLGGIQEPQKAQNKKLFSKLVNIFGGCANVPTFASLETDIPQNIILVQGKHRLYKLTIRDNEGKLLPHDAIQSACTALIETDINTEPQPNNPLILTHLRPRKEYKGLKILQNISNNNRNLWQAVRNTPFVVKLTAKTPNTPQEFTKAGHPNDSDIIGKLQLTVHSNGEASIKTPHQLIDGSQLENFSNNLELNEQMILKTQSSRPPSLSQPNHNHLSATLYKVCHWDSSPKLEQTIATAKRDITKERAKVTVDRSVLDIKKEELKKYGRPDKVFQLLLQIAEEYMRLEKTLTEDYTTTVEANDCRPSGARLDLVHSKTASSTKLAKQIASYIYNKHIPNSTEKIQIKNSMETVFWEHKNAINASKKLNGILNLLIITSTHAGAFDDPILRAILVHISIIAIAQISPPMAKIVMPYNMTSNLGKKRTVTAQADLTKGRGSTTAPTLNPNGVAIGYQLYNNGTIIDTRKRRDKHDAKSDPYIGNNYHQDLTNAITKAWNFLQETIPDFAKSF